MSRRSWDWRRDYERRHGPLPHCMGGQATAAAADDAPEQVAAPAPVAERCKFGPKYAEPMHFHAKPMQVDAPVPAPVPEPAGRAGAAPREPRESQPEPTPDAVLTEAQVWNLKKHVDDGLSVTEIAGRLGISRGVVAEKCGRLGLKTGPEPEAAAPPKPGPRADEDRHEAARRLVGEEGLTYAEAASRLGMSRSALAGLCYRLGIRSAGRSRPTDSIWTPELLGRVRALAGDGKSRREIAAALGLKRKQVSSACERHGISTAGKTGRPGGPETKARTPRKRSAPKIEPFWTEARLARLREMAAQGRTVPEAAAELGVSVQRIRWQAGKHGLTFAEAPRGPRPGLDVGLGPGIDTRYRPSGLFLRSPKVMRRSQPEPTPGPARRGGPGRHPEGGPHDDQVRTLFREGLTHAAIAARLGIPAGTVNSICRRLGLRRLEDGARHRKPASASALASAEQRGEPGNLTAAERDEIALMAGRGVGVTAIAAKLRRPYRVVIAAMEALGVSRSAAA